MADLSTKPGPLGFPPRLSGSVDIPTSLLLNLSGILHDSVLVSHSPSSDCINIPVIGGSVFVFSADVISVSRDAVSYPLLAGSFHQQSFIPCPQALQTRQYPGKCLVVLAFALPLPLPFLSSSLCFSSLLFSLFLAFALLVTFASLAFCLCPNIERSVGHHPDLRIALQDV